MSAQDGVVRRMARGRTALFRRQDPGEGREFILGSDLPEEAGVPPETSDWCRSIRRTTHRLRHSFATSLMNGGMSLMGIMKLLGHRDQRMTLRYTQIADETVGREYFEALSRVTERYATIGAATAQEIVTDPLQILQDVIRWLGKELCVGRTE